MNMAKPAPEIRTAKTPPTFAIVSSSAPPSSSAACKKSMVVVGAKRENERKMNEKKFNYLSTKKKRKKELVCTDGAWGNCTIRRSFSISFSRSAYRDCIVSEALWEFGWVKNNVFGNLLLNCTSAAALMEFTLHGMIKLRGL